MHIVKMNYIWYTTLIGFGQRHIQHTRTTQMSFLKPAACRMQSCKTLFKHWVSAPVRSDGVEGLWNYIKTATITQSFHAMVYHCMKYFVYPGISGFHNSITGF